MASKVKIGSVVRVKQAHRVDKRLKRQSTVVRGFFGPDIQGGVILAEAIDGFRCWNIEALEVVPRRKRA